MPSLSDHQSARFTKLLLIGDSGSGKTGALASLVGAGYKLRILDFDNGLDSLVQRVKQQFPTKASELLKGIAYETLRDKMKASPLGPIIDGSPKAFVRCIKLLDKWDDLGVPAEWGEDTILVLDSLTFCSDSAFAWAEQLVPRGKGGDYDKRAVYGMAQNAIESLLGMLTNEGFRANVIVTAHVRYIDLPDGTTKGYPTSVGKALSPTIPRYFNSVAMTQTQGTNRRTLQTISSALIDLKSPAAHKLAASLPIETALADYFKAVRS